MFFFLMTVTTTSIKKKKVTYLMFSKHKTTQETEKNECTEFAFKKQQKRKKK